MGICFGIWAYVLGFQNFEDLPNWQYSTVLLYILSQGVSCQRSLELYYKYDKIVKLDIPDIFIRYQIKIISPQARMKLPKKRRCVVAVQQPRRNQKRRGANVDGGGGEIVFSISFVISSFERVGKFFLIFQNIVIKKRRSCLNQDSFFLFP